jgi:hypothetical protein
MVKDYKNQVPRLELKLDRLHSLDRTLAAEVERKTAKLVRLRLAISEAKRVALLREAKWRQ